MGGQDGTRRSLVQAIVAVIQSLSNNEREYLTLEPDEGKEKVDIRWWDKHQNETVGQVKSSKTKFDRTDRDSGHFK